MFGAKYEKIQRSVFEKLMFFWSITYGRPPKSSGKHGQFYNKKMDGKRESDANPGFSDSKLS